MKKALIIAIIILPHIVFGQQDSTTHSIGDSLSWARSLIPAMGLTVTFYQPNSTILRPKYRKETFSKVPESLEYFKKYRRNQALFLGSTGVTFLFLIDAPNIGSTRGSTLIPGLGMFIVSYIFYRATNKNAEKAVRKWNEAMGY